MTISTIKEIRVIRMSLLDLHHSTFLVLIELNIILLKLEKYLLRKRKQYKDCLFGFSPIHQYSQNWSLQWWPSLNAGNPFLHTPRLLSAVEQP